MKTLLLLDEKIRTQGSSNRKAWLITVNDLFSLLISFFVLIYALNDRELTQKKRNSILQVDSVLHKKALADDNVIHKTMSQKKNYISSLLPLNYLYKILSAKVTSCAEGVVVTNGNNYISIAVPMGVLFENGKFTSAATDVLVCIADNINFIANVINIYSITELNSKDPNAKNARFIDELKKSMIIAKSLVIISGNNNINAFAYNKEYSKIYNVPSERIEIVINNAYY